MRSTFAVTILMAMLAVAFPLPVYPQTQDAAKERERRVLELLRRSQAAQQQASRERDEQAAARATLESTLKEAESSAGRVARQASALRLDLDRVNSLLATERIAAEQLKSDLAAMAAVTEKVRVSEAGLDASVRKLEEQNSERMRRIALREAQLRQLQATAEDRAASLAACSARAEQLYRAGNELLDRLQQRGVAESDSFLQWTRISAFDEVQRWRDRLDELRSGVPAENAGR